MTCVVVRAEVQQHGLLEPLVDGPLAVLLLGDARLAGVEQLDALLDGVAQRRRRILRGDVRAALEVPRRWWRRESSGRSLTSLLQESCGCAARRSRIHRPDATSEMRTRCRPGLPAARVARQVTARQDGEILRGEQVAREGFVVALHVGPQIEARRPAPPRRAPARGWAARARTSRDTARGWPRRARRRSRRRCWRAAWAPAWRSHDRCDTAGRA